MKYCCVPMCTSIGGGIEKIGFHTFPTRNLQLRAEWIKAISRKGNKPGSYWQPSKHTVICHKHFAASDFSISTFKNRQLLPNTVPSIFPNYPVHRLPKSSKKRKPPATRDVKSSAKKTCSELQYSEVTGMESETGKPSKDENHPDFIPNVFSYSVGMKRRSGVLEAHQKQREKNSLSTNQETKKVLSENSKSVSFSQSPATDLQKTYLQEKHSGKILDRQENRNMEYIYCAIPGCKSKSPKRTESSTVGDENILMFPVPKADKFFNKWKEAIKETKVELTKDDHVCECHFFEKDVQRCYRTRTTSGDIIEIPKRLPTLKADAVPCKYLKPSLHITKDPSKKISIFQNSIVSNSERNTTNKSSSNTYHSRNNTINIRANDSSFKSSADSSVNCIQEQISPKKKCMPYDELVKNIHLIEKPSLFWTVLCTDQFTIFARWNNKFCAEKRLVIESSLTVRVFLKEWEIEMTDLVDITCIDDVSSLLEKVDNYNLELTC